MMKMTISTPVLQVDGDLRAPLLTRSVLDPGGFAAFNGARRSPSTWIVLALVALFFSPAARAQTVATTTGTHITEADFQQFGLLAVQDGGRRKPLNTYAREVLLRITGGSFLGRAVYKDTTGRVWAPEEFLFSVLLGEGHDWQAEPMILLNYRPLVQQLGLDPERKRFSFAELSKLPALQKMANEVHETLRAGNKEEVDRTGQEVRNVSERMTLLGNLNRGASFLIVPPKADAKIKDAWITPPDAEKAFGEGRFDPARESLGAMASAFLAGDPFNFQLRARELRQNLRALSPGVYPTEAELGTESFYNRLGAFPKAAGFYVLALLLLAAGSLPSRAAGTLRAVGVLTGLVGLVLQATGLALRCVIAGRPPVTNMFESVVWVSFVVTLLGFLFWARYRTATYLYAALPVSALTMFLVLNAPVAMPPSIDPLVPVLRDNFWLSTHVLTETASYGAFALAMGFAHVVLFRYLLKPDAADRDAALHFWLYRVIQLGILLITVGTILGGVWANYSWGRFWGWDPKETWALITLLCYVAAIHGRMAGWWGNFGLAVASVLCFSAVVMAWYGVNFILGKGLHSYGFGVGGEAQAMAVIGVDLAFVGLVCWRRFGRGVRVAEAPAGRLAGERA